MKSIKSLFIVISLIAFSHLAHAESCVSSTEELARNSSREIPDFMRKLPANFASDDNSIRFKLTAQLRNQYDGNGKVIRSKHLFFGRWDSKKFGGGDLYTSKICVRGSAFTMFLENGATFKAELSGNNFVFKKLFKTYVLRPK